MGEEESPKKKLSSDLDKEKEDMSKDAWDSVDFFPWLFWESSDDETSEEGSDEETEDTEEESEEETEEESNDDMDQQLAGATDEEESTEESDDESTDDEETSTEEETSEEESADEDDEAINPEPSEEESQEDTSASWDEMSPEDAKKKVMESISDITRIMEEEWLIDVEEEVKAVQDASKKFDQNPTEANQNDLQEKITQLENELYAKNVSESSANKKVVQLEGLINDLQTQLDQVEIDKYKYAGAFDAVKNDAELREVAKIKAVYDTAPDNEDVKGQLIDKLSKMLWDISGINVLKIVQDKINTEKAKLKKDSSWSAIDVNVNIEDESDMPFMPM